MSSQFLPVIRFNLEFDLEEMCPAIVAGNVDLTDILAFCRNYRRKGICSLFIEGLPNGLHMNLHKSGRAFLHFLKNRDDVQKVTSWADPFFDAIACNDLDCACEIAKKSRMTWNSEEEYEDDFLYILFLMKYFFFENTEAKRSAIIERYEQVLDGAHDVHFELCKAFFYNDNKSFGAAFSEFLIEREERYRSLVSRESIPEEEAATEGFFSVEGLALVRLAEIKGFETQENYLFIPSVARKDVSIVFAPNSWKNVHQ